MLVLKVYGDLSLDALFQRDQCLGSHHTRDVLQTSVQQVHQLLVVTSKEFDHHGVWTSREVTFYDFWDVSQTLE